MSENNKKQTWKCTTCGRTEEAKKMPLCYCALPEFITKMEKLKKDKQDA